MFTELTNDRAFIRSVIFTCDTIQVGQDAQNVETLNRYIDPEDSIRSAATWSLTRGQIARTVRERDEIATICSEKPSGMVDQPRQDDKMRGDSLDGVILAGHRQCPYICHNPGKEYPEALPIELRHQSCHNPRGLPPTLSVSSL